jgi:subtilisin family serine protease
MASGALPGAPVPGPPVANAPRMPPEQHEPGQLVVLWDESSEAQDGLAVMAHDYSALPINRVDLNNLGGTLATFQLPDNKRAAALVAILRQKYSSWHVDLHARYLPLDGARIYLPSTIDAPSQRSASPNLRIGMLDGAVAPIQALRDVGLVQQSFLSDADKSASSEHGTSIAALIAGRDQGSNFYGFSAGARLYAGTIMRDLGGHEGSTNTAMLLRGLDWLVGEKVRIINLSLGGPGNDLMASVFEKLQKRGLTVIAAAGNGGPDAPPSYPAAYRGVIAVTAVDALDRSYANANRGNYIALAAPGVDVWIPDADKGHYVTGTSFSAAVVTSAVGLMLSLQPDLSADLVREHLCLGARDLGTPGHDPVYGCGLLQIGRTLARLKSSNSFAERTKTPQ